MVLDDLARDQAGRLVDLVHKKGTTTFAGYDYYYDLASQITRMVSKDDGTRGVGYAPDGQVTHAALLGPTSFAAAVTYTTGNHTSSVRLGDVNGDGKLDLVTANAASSSIVVNLGVGDGTFQLAPTSSVNFIYVMDLGLADLNGDGKVDILAVSHLTANNARVYFGDGAGNYSVANSVALPSAGLRPIAMALFDLNADGKLDLMTANYEGGNVTVMLGVGNGTFGAATNYAVGPEPMGVSAGDVNSDGFADIVATVPGQSRVMVLLGNGQGSFAAGIPYTTGAIPSDVIVIDATGDGRADILTANLAGTVSLLRQLANGTLAPKVEITVGSTPFALTVADMDQDGVADLVTANQVVDTVSVLKGLGGGSFSAPVEYSVEQQAGIYRPFAVTTGDLNSDGNADVVVANWLDDNAVSEPFSVSVLLRNTPSVENFRYDAGGTRTGAGSGGAYVAGDHNELDADGRYTYQYDRLGNLATRTETATGKVTEYAWDIHNRLTKVTYRASAGGAVTGTAEYAYDMNGRRMRRKVDIDGLAGFEIDERFVYDGDHLALVFDAAGTLTNRYLSADAIDAALAEDDFFEGTANATEWLLADHQGTVRDIVRETGDEITHVAYDSFGNITGVTAAPGTVPVAPRLGYTGQERDPETGLMYYGARYYDPKTGRFISQDPTGYGAGDPNLYRYVMNSPVIYIDPTGLRQQTPANGLESLLRGAQAIGSAISNQVSRQVDRFTSYVGNLSTIGSTSLQALTTIATASPFTGVPGGGTLVSQGNAAYLQGFVGSLAEQGVSAAGSAVANTWDFAKGMWELGTDSDMRGAFPEAWDETRVQPLANRLVGKADQRQLEDPGYLDFAHLALEDMIGAPAVEAYYNVDLATGNEIGGELFDLGPRTQMLAGGLSSFVGATAGLSAGAMAFGKTVGGAFDNGGFVSPSTSNNALNILNPEFTPNGTRVLQNLTNKQNSLLGSDLSRAASYLSRAELEATANPYVARMQYGNALERMVGAEVESDALLKSLFQYNTTGKGPDFFGRGLLQNQIFDITTPRQAPAHLGRPYGQGLNIITYHRPGGFP